MAKSSKTEVSRRQALMDRRDPDNVPGDPIELPAGTYKPKSVSVQIQEQIAINIAKKHPGE